MGKWKLLFIGDIGWETGNYYLQGVMDSKMEATIYGDNGWETGNYYL